MTIQWDHLDNFHQRFGERILTKHHRGRRVDKAINASNLIHRYGIYVGELCIALVLSFSTLIFGNGKATPNNQSLVYPLQEVSTVECRTQEWHTLPTSCKLELPIIHDADYAAYRSNAQYTGIYSVLYGGNYKDGWAIDEGSHYAVDIASAKGTPLYSIADGKVYFAGQQAGYGNVVKIEFVYQGTRYFAIYGHMDTLLVKTGQSVSRGQKIGTVGNSGVAFGGLGGFHVHFEIAKGDNGRPTYAFYNCADISKGGIHVINNGLCRAEMFEHTTDPIALLEGANAKFPHVSTLSADSASLSEEEHAVADLIDSNHRPQIVKIAKLYLDSPYQYGGTGTLPGEVTDCSNLTQNVFRNVGIQLERSSNEQAHQFSHGGYWYESLEKAEVGDLLFFRTDEKRQEISHVGIYLGDNHMIHGGTKKVEITSLNSYWKKAFKGVGSFKLFAQVFNPEKAQSNYLTLLSKPTPTPPTQHTASTPAPEAPKPTIGTVTPVEPPQLTPQGSPSLPIAPQDISVDEFIIPLDLSKLDTSTQNIFSNWNLTLSGDTTPMKTNETKSFTLTMKKADGDVFNGILQQPIIFVANSTNISIDPVAISLVKNGEVQINLTAQTQGEVYIAIQIGTTKIGNLTFQIQ